MVHSNALSSWVFCEAWAFFLFLFLNRTRAAKRSVHSQLQAGWRRAALRTSGLRRFSVRQSCNRVTHGMNWGTRTYLRHAASCACK